MKPIELNFWRTKGKRTCLWWKYRTELLLKRNTLITVGCRDLYTRKKRRKSGFPDLNLGRGQYLGPSGRPRHRGPPQQHAHWGRTWKDKGNLLRSAFDACCLRGRSSTPYPVVESGLPHHTCSRSQFRLKKYKHD